MIHDQRRNGNRKTLQGFIGIKDSLIHFEERPGILGHIFATIHPNRLGIAIMVFIGIAIHFAHIDMATVMPFDENVFAMDGAQRLLDIGNEVPQIGGVVFFP